MMWTAVVILSVIVVCGVIIGMKKRTKKTSRSKTILEDRLRNIDRVGYVEPSKGLVLCSFCMAKNEVRAPKCWNCGAKL